MSGLPSDFSEIRGQEGAKRALAIAVAGGHHALLVGPTGSGKTSLARSLSSILPPPPEPVREEVARIYALADLPSPAGTPLRLPSVTATPAVLVGGRRSRRPGEASLAHGGVLVLDEVHAFGKRSLQALIGPLDVGDVVLSGVEGGILPAGFTLVAVGTLCACGNRGSHIRSCSCSSAGVRRHWRRIPAALLERMALHIEVPAMTLSTLRSRPPEESAEVRERVELARERQRRRTGTSNGALRLTELSGVARLDRQGVRLLDAAFRRLSLTARGRHQVLQVARTIADLAGSETVRAPHVAEAIQYRGCEKRSKVGVLAADRDGDGDS